MPWHAGRKDPRNLKVDTNRPRIIFQCRQRVCFQMKNKLSLEKQGSGTLPNCVETWVREVGKQFRIKMPCVASSNLCIIGQVTLFSLYPNYKMKSLNCSLQCFIQLQVSTMFMPPLLSNDKSSLRTTQEAQLQLRCNQIL